MIWLSVPALKIHYYPPFVGVSSHFRVAWPCRALKCSIDDCTRIHVIPYCIASLIRHPRFREGHIFVAQLNSSTSPPTTDHHRFTFAVSFSRVIPLKSTFSSSWHHDPVVHHAFIATNYTYRSTAPFCLVVFSSHATSWLLIIAS